MSLKEVLLSLFLLIAGVLWARAEPPFQGYYACIAQNNKVAQFLDQRANPNYEDGEFAQMAMSGMWIIQKVDDRGKTWRVLPIESTRGDVPERRPYCSDDDLGEISRSYGMNIKEYEKEGEDDEDNGTESYCVCRSAACKGGSQDYVGQLFVKHQGQIYAHDGKADSSTPSCSEADVDKIVKAYELACAGDDCPMEDELTDKDLEDVDVKDKALHRGTVGGVAGAGPKVASAGMGHNSSSYRGYVPGVATGGPPRVSNPDSASNKISEIMDNRNRKGPGRNNESSPVLTNSHGPNGGWRSNGGRQGLNGNMEQLDRDLEASADGSSNAKKLIKKWSDDGGSLADSSNCNALFGDSKEGASDQDKFNFLQQASGCLGEVFDMVGTGINAVAGGAMDAIVDFASPNSI